MIDHDTVVTYAEDQNIPFTSFASLAGSPEGQQRAGRELEATTRGVARKALNEQSRHLIGKMHEEA